MSGPIALFILLFEISSSVSFCQTRASTTLILEFRCPAQKPSVVLQIMFVIFISN